MSFVHNHGPAEGRGLDCPEYNLGDRLVGFCLLDEAGFQRKPNVCWATIAGSAIADRVNLETELAKAKREIRRLLAKVPAECVICSAAITEADSGLCDPHKYDEQLQGDRVDDPRSPYYADWGGRVVIR